VERKINIVTMGCSKNLVDSEHLAARCAAAGYEILFDSNDESADVVVVNTCGFIGDAKQESIDTILAFAAARAEGRVGRLHVIGCLSERYADELRAEIPEVDSFFGARGLDGIVAELEAEAAAGGGRKGTNAVREAGAAERAASGRVLSTPAHYAYLKISEGCDRRCGFCAIPLIRGGHVSVPMEELVAEAGALAARGVRELIVVAQDTTYYGLDLYGERRLAELLRRLARIEGLEWIRLHYAYPAGFPDDVIEAMASEPKICKYLDIPLQHIAEGQLRSMKRGLGGEGTRALIARLRAAIPGLAIRTTMLVGYPGETEADFEELMAFVREARFERLGVFPYSAEEGTYSADTLADDVPEEVKTRRVERLMELQAGISAEVNAARVGGVERVVVDRREGDVWVCRSQWDSPEVDGEVIVAAGERALRPGGFARVRVTGADEYDLTAELT
jgi:ribosomal protein S12 methylthiotransferase